MTTTTPHPYAHILHAIAEGKNVQWQTSDGGWANQSPTATLLEISNQEYSPERYRVHVKTMRINGHEVPEPLRQAPAAGSDVFMPHLSDTTPVCHLTWHGDSHQQTLLARGLLHTTESNCEAHAEALLSFTSTTP